MKNLITTASIALALAGASVVHAADVPRASAPVEAESEIGGGSTLIYILLAVLLSGGLSFGDLFGDDEDDPDSP